MQDIAISFITANHFIIITKNHFFTSLHLRRMKRTNPMMAKISAAFLTVWLFFLRGISQSEKFITPAIFFLYAGRESKNAKLLSSSSSFSSSCCNSWYPCSNRCSCFKWSTFSSTNLLDPAKQSTTESFLPWKTMTGTLKLFQCFCTHSMETKSDLAIFTLRKGIMSRSSKILCMNLLFLVRAVGLTIELMIKSYSSSPICFTMNSFKKDMFLSLGMHKRGLVIMHPLMLSRGLSSSSLIVTSPPMLCPQMYRGRSGRAWDKSVMTSFSSISTVAHPLGPPEYPNPVRSMRRTSNSWIAQQWATSLNLPECSPKPWMMAIVLLGSLGVNLV